MCIYEYFSCLYHNVDGLKEEDILIKKYHKMINLFKVFYQNGDNKNVSSISSLGGTLKIIFNKPLIFSEGYQLLIDINISYYNFDNINKNLNIIKIREVRENYDSLLKIIDKQKLISINFSIGANNISIEFITDKRILNIAKNVQLTEISEIYFLEQFYGQISSIDISIKKEVNTIIYNYIPI